MVKMNKKGSLGSLFVSVMIILLVVGAIFFSSYTSIKIVKCEEEFSDCRVFKCQAEESLTYGQTRTYLLKEQNCLLEQGARK